MTDNEIIKGLEEITNAKIKYGARKLVLADIDLLKDALNLIKNQQAEIEILEQSCQEMSKDVKRLWKDCDFFEDKAKNTAKVFAEKLKELYETEGIITDDMKVPIGVIRANIDDIVDEMVGANNDR